MEGQGLDLTPLRRAIAALDAGIGVVHDTDWFEVQSSAVRETLMAGVIQQFEFVYELAVKTVRRALEMEEAIPGETDALGFRDMLRVAAEKGIVADVERWFAYRHMRNITAHTYDWEKAQVIYDHCAQFLADVRDVLHALEARHG